MRIKLIILTIILCLNTEIYAVYRTQIFNQNIKTLQIGIKGENYLHPIIELKSNDLLKVSFDEMSHEAHSFGYKIIHCNSDWSPSNLSTNEYLSGYTTANISDYKLSQLTTFLYTHYQFELPNTDINFKISGNYVVFIYEDNQIDKPIAQACFSVVEPKVSINAKIRANTDIELNGRLQQVDFDLMLNGIAFKDAKNEIKVVVRQNNRTDNEVSSIQPSFISGSKLSYINNKDLIFEGGYEYHSFDISSIYAANSGVAEIRYKQPNYEAYLKQDIIQKSKKYMHNFDVNGKFVVNLQNAREDIDIHADYLNVHFMLPTNQPFIDGQIYLGGEFNYNLLNDNSRLQYDFNASMYYKSILLKQGGYNYQYWFVPKNSTKAIVERVEGSYWETKNEYTIYVYYRGWGERYDKLVGIKSI